MRAQAHEARAELAGGGHDRPGDVAGVGEVGGRDHGRAGLARCNGRDEIRIRARRARFRAGRCILCSALRAFRPATAAGAEQPGKGDDTRAWGPPFLHGEPAYFLRSNRNTGSATRASRNA